MENTRLDQARAQWEALSPEQQIESYRQNIRGLLLTVGTLCDTVDSLAELLIQSEPYHLDAGPLNKAANDAKSVAAQLRQDYDLITLLPEIRKRVAEEENSKRG